LIKKITKTPLFKISSLNSLSVIVKIGIGLITSKLLAIFVGPAGMAMVGNFKNFTSSLESISTLGFQTGIIKYVAENKEDKSELKKIFSTVFISLICVAIILSGVLYFSASFLNLKIFGNNYEFEVVFIVAGLALPWYVISIFWISVINGLGEYKKVIWIAILGNIIGLIISLVLILNYKTLGALLAIVLTPAMLFFVTSYFVNKELSFFSTILFKSYDFKIIKNLSSYSLMAIVSSIMGPIVYIAIRNNVIKVIGIEEAGFWETITRISSYYMMFSSTILTVYFLPKLAKSKNNLETKTVFWSYYKSILPLFVIGLLTIYFFRSLIIEILFTKEFLPVTSLFFWQLIGDVFKVAFLILGFQFLAKKMTLAFIISEITSLAVLYFASNYLITIFGIQGVVMAQALDNLIYLIVLVVYFRKSLF
jgi:O-antigen/teichoic acid export membrane protein